MPLCDEMYAPVQNSINELKESVRQKINEDSFDNVDCIYIDSDGKISVVKKKIS